MKTVILILAGIVLCFSALLVPSYTWKVFSVEAAKHDGLWWAFPASLTLIFAGLILLISGVALIVYSLGKRFDN
ncbi:MAG TPA: hypothetical protein PLE92_04340, partial [Lentisphaeria bacterium]|nr:hypothetical protein [Lentisphaeria bacterium]